MSQLEGVFSVHEPHFWTLCSDVYCGAVKLEVAQKADIKYIQSQTHNIFTAVSPIGSSYSSSRSYIMLLLVQVYVEVLIISSR